MGLHWAFRVPGCPCSLMAAPPRRHSIWLHLGGFHALATGLCGLFASGRCLSSNSSGRFSSLGLLSFGLCVAHLCSEQYSGRPDINCRMGVSDGKHSATNPASGIIAAHNCRTHPRIRVATTKVRSAAVPARIAKLFVLASSCTRPRPSQVRSAPGTESRHHPPHAKYAAQHGQAVLCIS